MARESALQITVARCSTASGSRNFSSLSVICSYLVATTLSSLKRGARNGLQFGEAVFHLVPVAAAPSRTRRHGLALTNYGSGLQKAPHHVSSTDQEVANWANLGYLICLIVALAIGLWRFGRLSLSLWREPKHMLPARQY
jgi:hypothetical protein